MASTLERIMEEECKNCAERLRNLQSELMAVVQDLEDTKERNRVLERKLKEVTGNDKKRADKHKVKKGPASKTCLVLGDSLVRGAGKKDRRADVKCFPGFGAEKLRHALEAEDLGRPDVVIMHVGTYDIRRLTLDYLMGEAYDLVCAAKTKFPNATFVLSGIFRREDIPWSYIESANDHYAWVAKCLDIWFVDPNSWVQDGDISRDGFHLTNRGSFKLGRLYGRIRATASTGKQDGDILAVDVEEKIDGDEQVYAISVNGGGDNGQDGDEEGGDVFDEYGTNIWRNCVGPHGDKVWDDSENDVGDEEKDEGA